MEERVYALTKSMDETYWVSNHIRRTQEIMNLDRENLPTLCMAVVFCTCPNNAAV